MLFALALIPVIGLLCFIYFNDKNEKEPFGLLIALFFAGMGTAIPAYISEIIGQGILDSVFPYDSAFKNILLAAAVVGPVEEIGKYFILWIITWKNKHFNYSYDAIVYAVFVSLGFAAIENVLYVFSNGWGTALLRMFTAVPGHAYNAVFMGYFYSKAKYSAINNNKSKCLLFSLLSIFTPIVIHGIYDAIIMGGVSEEMNVTSVICVLLWIAYLIGLTVLSIIFVIRSSRNDYCIVNLPEENVQIVYKPTVIGTWTCGCGAVNTLNFCPKCGKPRPLGDTWTCPICGRLSAFNFCGTCGHAKPLYQNPYLQNH